jgi:hypothetical protein
MPTCWSELDLNFRASSMSLPRSTASILQTMNGLGPLLERSNMPQWNLDDEAKL